jgi:ParB family chromosome partitioning protein
MLKNKSLGRNMERLFNVGEGSKIETNLVKENHYEAVKMIGLDNISASSYQPRTDFDDAKIKELAHSIKAQGVIQPIILRADRQGAYVIIAGERRFKAAKEAGLTKIPAIVINYSEKDASLVALIENIQREDLNPIDKAEALARLIADYKLKQQELAQILGMSRTQITNTLRFLKMQESVRLALFNNLITEGHAKVLAGLLIEDQIYYCQQIELKHLSVRQLEDLIVKDSDKDEKVQINKKAKQDSPFIAKLKRSVEEYFLTKVDLLDDGKGKGKIVLYYHSYDELNGVIDKMAFQKEMF